MCQPRALGLTGGIIWRAAWCLAPEARTGARGLKPEARHADTRYTNRPVRSADPAGIRRPHLRSRWLFFSRTSARSRRSQAERTTMIGTMLGPYRVLEKLGEGGMGEVYRAHDTNLGRDVALKILPDSVAADADRLARFEREA